MEIIQPMVCNKIIKFEQYTPVAIALTLLTFITFWPCPNRVMLYYKVSKKNEVVALLKQQASASFLLGHPVLAKSGNLRKTSWKA